MMDVSKSERQRQRWRRNKQAKRARTNPIPPSPPEMLVVAVMAERDRRVAIMEGAWRLPFAHAGSVERTIAFLADTWAMKTLLEKQYGAGKATPTRIARLLGDKRRSHGYAAGSLRPMIYRALDRIIALETMPRNRHSAEPYWPPFHTDDEASN